MKSKVSSVLPKVNFYDGQKVTESDLDTEQLHNQSISGGIINDFHGSGVVKDDIFNSIILFDTSKPGYYAAVDSVTSKETIEAGRYDGKPLYLDLQPSDKEYGNRLEVSLSNVDVKGKDKTKVLILGYAFDSINVGGQLVYEVLSFETNKPQITKYYYLNISSILLNNFSGGTGKTENSLSEESLNLVGESGKLIIKEVEPLKVYSAPLTTYQILSPANDLNNFITYSEDVSIEELIKEALGSSANFNDLYFEQLESKISSFEKNGSVTVSYGQKFLAKTDNIQRIDVLLSVEQDSLLPAENQYDFSGELVFSIHKLSTETQCSTDLVPDNLIDFDPEIEPLMEVSISQEDLLSMGTVLSSVPQVVSFNFSGTLLADPSISPSLEKNNFYCFLISRRGDTSTGKINLHVGYDEPSRRESNDQPKNAIQEFGNQISRYFEYDTITKKYVDYSDYSLWHQIHSNTVEVTPGTAYSNDGFLITIPKYEEYIGDTKIPNYIDNISLVDISQSSYNYILLEHIEKFITPATHPRTGNFVFTRIFDTGAISVVNSADLATITEEKYPLVIASVVDTTTRAAEEISGVLDKPGLIDRDYVTLVSPADSLFSSNLVDRLFIPDTNCNCTYKYKIVKTECISYKVGDLDNNGSIESNDLNGFLNYIGTTINSEATERKILNGDISYVGFKQSDLNGDDSVDGTDLELLEDAIDGNLGFSADKSFKILKIYLENILDTANYPTIFEDIALSGETEESTSNLTFIVDDEKKATIIRAGDLVVISNEAVGAGTYYISSKTILDDNVTVTVSLKLSDGSSPSFNAETGFNVTIVSGTATNILADNLNLSQIPFESTSYKIDFIDSTYKSEYLEICDLRRFVSRSFIEEKTSNCKCEDNPCGLTIDCAPVYKNQAYVSGDIYIPDGEILSAPGIPYHGDIEYVTITVPLPPGSIEDCQVDLYNTFIKSEGSSCLTAAGYPAMKYSDGTYVGCEDSGLNTDIAKGRVKINNAIASLHVDGLVDGYAVDGYADSTSATSSTNVISESFTDYSYTSFDSWSEDSGNSTVVTITHLAGSNEPATFELTTENSSGTRYGKLNSPLEISAMSGDLLIDITALRLVWSSSYPQGRVSSYTQINVTNDDSSYSTLKFGWRQFGTNEAQLFYSGEIYDNLGSLQLSFEHTAEIPDDVGDEILFRIRRIDDAFFIYYINPEKILDGVSFENFGQYIRIGTNPDIQPGSGSVSLSFSLEQSDNPTSGLYYASRFRVVEARSKYSTGSNDSNITISRDSAVSEINRAAISFPIEINSRTNIISAKMTLTLADSISSSDVFNVIPLAIIDADNLAPYYNYPTIQDNSFIESFSPGTLSSGDQIEVDITNIITKFVSEPGFLPGYYKAIIIEPDSSTNSALLLDQNILFEISYEDISTGVIFKVGVSIDPTTGVASFKTKNILYDSINPENRTTIKFGVYLKKSGFINKDLSVSISDLKKIGLGSCADENLAIDESSECYFVVGTTGVGTYVEGPFSCAFSYPK